MGRRESEEDADMGVGLQLSEARKTDFAFFKEERIYCW